MREPLTVEVTVRDPDLGETIRHTISRTPHEGDRKDRVFPLMLDLAREEALHDLDRLYDGGVFE